MLVEGGTEKKTPMKMVEGGGAVAEWSKSLLLLEKINEKPKDPRFSPVRAIFKKSH